MNLRIQTAGPEDAPTVHQLVKQAFQEYTRPGLFPRSLSALEETLEEVENDIRTREVLLAWYDEHPAGTVRYHLLPDGTAYFGRLGVLAPYRHKGIARALLAVVEGAVAEAGAHALRLHTPRRLSEAAAFYTRLGYKVQAVEEKNGIVRYHMVKALVIGTVQHGGERRRESGDICHAGG
ncbi:MAG: GNAT family N-acetyltransferase [Firmicutes bacterium]|nr:GNAT family N-acetyltransferase [Bacillota bacterium]